MPRDPLLPVLTVRRRAVEEARAALAAAISAAAQAHNQAREAERDIEQETIRASDPAGGDNLVEAFAAWLPPARHRALQARANHDTMEAEVARRRAELTASRIALETIETLAAQRKARQAEAETRRQAHLLDEAAARAHRNQP